MMNRKGGFLLFIMTAVVLAAGCSEEQKKDTRASENVSAEKVEEETLTFPERYEEDVDEILSFHASVTPPNGLSTENKEIQVVYKHTDFDTALEELFSDMGEIQKEEQYMKEVDFWHQYAYNEYDESLLSSIGMLRMEKMPWRKVKGAIELSRMSQRCNAELYATPQEFGFGTAEECWVMLQQTLEKLGLETELEPTFFYMDHETLQAEDEKYKYIDEFRDPNEVRTWSEEDDGYYISAVQCLDGIPVYANTYFGNGLEGEADTANVLAYINKDGIQMLEVTRIFGELRETDETWELLPFEDIVDAVKKRFSLVLTGDKAEVQELRFSYMTEGVGDEVYRLLPVWFCNYEQTGADGSSRTEQLIIHAATGEEVIYELY